MKHFIANQFTDFIVEQKSGYRRQYCLNKEDNKLSRQFNLLAS